MLVYGSPEFSGQHMIRPDGKITMPFLGDVMATGITPAELSYSIKDKLKKYIVDPDVSVSVSAVNSKSYYIQGEVNRTGEYKLLVPTKVLEALVNAGGFKDFANQKKIVIMRVTRRASEFQLQRSHQGQEHGPEHLPEARRHHHRPLRRIRQFSSSARQRSKLWQQHTNFVTVTRRPPDVEDYIDMLRRYRSWLIGPMFAGLVIAVVVAFLWPDTYVSQAVMRITPQQISDRLVPTVVNMQMQQRLEQMQQEILSRGSLIGADSASFAGPVPEGAPALSHGRHRPGYAQQGDPHSDRRCGRRRRVASAFTISFSYPDRFKAQAVVRELVTKFTEQNVTVQRNQANLTSDFLSDEMKQAKDRMDGLEHALMEFKIAEHGPPAGTVPGQRGAVEHLSDDGVAGQ